MNSRNTKRRVPTQFAPETRFVIEPIPTLPFRETLETDLERLKRTLLEESLSATGNSDWFASLRHASNEAASLAWLTGFPLLVFPELFREKTAKALMQEFRQGTIKRRSERLLIAV